MTWYRSATLQSLVLVASRMGAGVLNFALFAVAARVLGVEGFGVFSVIFSAVMLTGGLGGLGQQSLLVKEVPRARVDEDFARERGAFRFALTVTLIGGLVTGMGLALWLWWRVEGITALTITAGAVMSFLFAVSQTTVGALRVEGFTVLGVFTRDFMWRLLNVAVIAMAGWVSGRMASRVAPSAVVVIMASTLVPVVLLHWWLLRREWDGRWGSVAPAYELRSWAPLSAGLAIIGAMSGADLYLFTIMVSRTVTATVAGGIFAAMKCVDLISLFLMATGLIVGPEVSQIVATKDRVALQRKCNAVLLLQGVPAVAVSLLILAIAPWILWLFDPEYVTYVGVLRMLVLAMLVNVMTGVTNLLLQLSGLHWYQVIFQVGSLAVALAALPFFVGRLGPEGVAWCYFIRQLVWNGLAVMLLRRRIGIDPSVLAFATSGSGSLRVALHDAFDDLGAVFIRVKRRAA